MSQRAAKRIICFSHQQQERSDYFQFKLSLLNRSFLFSADKSYLLPMHSSYFLSEISENCYTFGIYSIPFLFSFFQTPHSRLNRWLLVQEIHLRRTRKLIETKLSSRNLIKGINTWAVPLVIYSGPFIKWTRDELTQMDQRTRKLMTMHKASHPRDDVDRLYVSRKEGGRGLVSIEDSVDASIQRLEDYIEKHERGLITAIRNDTDNTIGDRMTTTRKQKWEKK